MSRSIANAFVAAAVRPFGFVLLTSVLALALRESAEAGTIVIEDTTFDNGSWSISTQGASAGSVVSGTQFPVGGNPGTFRYNSLQNGGAGFAFRSANAWNFFTATPYDPSVSGAILSLDYSEDSLRVNTAGGLQTGRLALRQGGLLYLTEDAFNFQVNTVDWKTNSYAGITAADFGLYFLNPVTNSYVFVPSGDPDFSESGAPIEFGYLRSYGVGSSFFTDSGIDNWRVVLTTEAIPEPSTLAFAIAAIIGSVQRGRAREEGA